MSTATTLNRTNKALVACSLNRNVRPADLEKKFCRDSGRDPSEVARMADIPLVSFCNVRIDLMSFCTNFVNQVHVHYTVMHCNDIVHSHSLGNAVPKDDVSRSSFRSCP